MSDEQKLGATGKFPMGKLNKEDEGELRLAVGVHPNGNVLIDFGKSVAWIGMAPDDAIQFSLFIKKRALEAKGNSPTIFIRASGDTVCEECGDTYYHHPRDMKQLSDLDLPFLHVLCDGRRVKL